MLKTSVLPEIGEFLEEHGYRRKRYSFYGRNECNVMVVDFQMSRETNKATALFTMNAGVFCNQISRILNSVEQANPAIEECHLRTRLCEIPPVCEDMWWSMDAATDVGTLVSELQSVLTATVLPYLRRYSSDEGLRDLWISGSSPGLTEVRRLMYLSALAKANGWKECCSMACDQLRSISDGKPWSVAASAHIRKLDSVA